MHQLLNYLSVLGLPYGVNSSYGEVIEFLASLKDSGTTVRLKLTSHGTAYSGKVAALNVKHRVLVVEEVSPAIAWRRLKPGHPIILRVESGGRKIECVSHFQDFFLPGIQNGLQLLIPKEIRSNLPRSAFRALLYNMDKVKITLKGQGISRLHGVVKNISCNGVGFTAQGDIPAIGQSGSQVMDCRISLFDNTQINCKMEIRSVRKTDDKGSDTYLGGRLLHVDKKDQQILRDFIKDLRRQFLQPYLS